MTDKTCPALVLFSKFLATDETLSMSGYGSIHLRLGVYFFGTVKHPNCNEKIPYLLLRNVNAKLLLAFSSQISYNWLYCN